MFIRAGLSKGKQDLPEFISLFPSWANPDALEPKPAPYPKQLVGSFALALQHGFVSNRLLAKLKPDKLKASGWNPKLKQVKEEDSPKKKKKEKKGKRK